ncbi:hypothetical protein ACIRVF_34935 [Kitasatospora sp. NPDC101157]|uniref:hypothetical protein n=1 Tax=Kitasatospora sp. NPDC101157 TaxID=3364098 RepID=UPI0038137555
MNPNRAEDTEPDEHARLAYYRREFAQTATEDAAELVARVLADPDRAMASGAVCEYLDRRAAELLTGPEFPAWRRELASAAAADDFAGRRGPKDPSARSRAAQRTMAASTLRQSSPGSGCSAAASVSDR